MENKLQMFYCFKKKRVLRSLRRCATVFLCSLPPISFSLSTAVFRFFFFLECILPFRFTVNEYDLRFKCMQEAVMPGI